MSCFDTVVVDCPQCGSPIEFQSKGGPCDMKRYHYKDVPAGAAGYCDGEEAHCAQCGKGIKLKVPRVEIQVYTPVRRGDDDEDVDGYD